LGRKGSGNDRRTPPPVVNPVFLRFGICYSCAFARVHHISVRDGA
jgi:hypothetical protein